MFVLLKGQFIMQYTITSNYERGRQRPLVSLRITEKSQCERPAGLPAGRGHAFESLTYTSASMHVRLTNEFLSWVATFLLS